MVVIFEGADASGKDFMRAAFNRKNGYEDDAVVRFGFSSLVYAAYYKRPLWICPRRRIEYIRMMRQFMRAVDPLIVFVTASQDVTDTRIASRQENVAAHPAVRVINALYKQVFELVGIPQRSFLEFDTSAGQRDLGTQLDVLASRIKHLKETKHGQRKCYGRVSQCTAASNGNITGVKCRG